jgi:RNA:NAD 2'-phosphotransferase (TPT1/KptA family)
VKALSRRLPDVLRHNPGSVGPTLDAHGWVDADEALYDG